MAIDMNLRLNGKVISFPSFFWISNLGGGGSDKYRETVYLDLYDGVPTLYNYYYLKYPDFAQKWLKNIKNYSSFGSFLKYTRESMINDEGYICKEHISSQYDYDNNIYLLDSGAANIINDILTGKIGDIRLSLKENIVNEMIEYYDFANRLKFDFVIGFDLGGKYTFKDGENQNVQLQKDLSNIDSDKLNRFILEETIKYLKQNDYHPRVYATVHGNTPKEYKEYTEYILKLEEQFDYKFFGFALGGIASSKNVDEKWFNKKEKLNNSNKNVILANKATKIVKGLVGERYIHVLGGGGKNNIIPIVLSGATSFDCQTPGRRAYDGNEDSVNNVFDSSAKGSFSKYLPGKFSEANKTINNNIDFEYEKINKIDDNLKLCNCPACKCIHQFGDVKKLYSKKNVSNEYYYYARQLCNSHAIWQHYFITKIAGDCNDYEKIKEIYDDNFINSLEDVFNYDYEGD